MTIIIMEYSIKVLVVVILGLIVALIIVALVFGFGQNIEDSGSLIFDFFRGLLGITE